MRIFEYTVHKDDSDQRGKMNHTTKGMVIVDNHLLDHNKIKQMIIFNFFNNDKNCTVRRLYELPHLT
jgi:hypothetical protein